MIIIGNSPLPYHVQIWCYPEHLIYPSSLVTVFTLPYSTTGPCTPNRSHDAIILRSLDQNIILYIGKFSR